MTFAAGALALYSPALNGPFVYDSTNIANGSLLHITSLWQLDRIVFAEGVPRRIGLASFALNFYFDGLRPFGYHLVNVLLHATNAFLLYWLACAILGSVRVPFTGERKTRLVAMSAAGLWMIHPIQTPAVSYVYQRFTVLSSLFFLLSLCCWVAARRRSSRFRAVFYAASLASALLALGTKEIAATLPLFLLLLEVVVLRERPFTWERRDVVLAILCLSSSLVIGAVYLGPDFVPMMANDYMRRGFTLYERLLTESRVVVYYISLLLFPHPSRLTLDYDFPLSTGLLAPPTTLVALGCIAASLGVASRRARTQPLFFFSVLWFFGNLAVESTFVPLDLVYEHRLYLPSMMLFVWFTAEIIGRPVSPRLRKLASGTVVLLACVFCYWTYQRNIVWSDPVALWEDNVEKSPGKARVHANLGNAYLARGQHVEARMAFEKAIELDPSMVRAYTSLANVHIDYTKQWSEATRLLDEVLERAPEYVPAHVGLGVMRLRLGDFPRAGEIFEKALELDETNQAALYNFGAVHFNLNDYAKAIVILEKGTYYWPANARMHALLGAAFAKMGAHERAEISLQQSLALEPDNALAMQYLEKVTELEP